MRLHVCAHAYVFFDHPYLLRQGLSLNSALTSWLDWPASQLQGSTCLCSPALRLETHVSKLAFFNMSLGDLNSGPHAYTAGFSLTEPSPKPYR